ncbi:MAG: tetratricopeptide repeat protein [Terrimonas sp.]|nr:tetratricopeptide repeat protein [Terrimonas sp.]
MKLFYPLLILISLISACNGPEGKQKSPYRNAEDSLNKLINSVRDSIRLYPREPRLRYNLAVVLQDAGRYQEALAALDSMHLSKPDPEHPFIFYNYLFKKSELQELAGDTIGAIRSLVMLTQPGELTQAGLRLASLYAATKNPETLRICDGMIAHDSLHRSPEPNYFKGVYYDNIREEEKAIQQFDESIRKDYTFIDAYLEKGRILYHQKKYAEALKVYQLALNVSNAFADTYFWIGKCQEALGQKEEAKLNYQRAYGLDKTLTDARDAAEKL